MCILELGKRAKGAPLGEQQERSAAPGKHHAGKTAELALYLRPRSRLTNPVLAQKLRARRRVIRTEASRLAALGTVDARDM